METAVEIPEEFSESYDFPGDQIDPSHYKNVPGWVSLERFLREDLGVDNYKALKIFRSSYNKYLKRFPVHYFTQASMPDVDFALFFPAKAHIKGVSNPHYLVAISHGKKLVLFHRSLMQQIKTRENFYRQTQRWLSGGFKNKKVPEYDLQTILDICQDPENLLKYRTQRFAGFLQGLSKQLKRQNQLWHFDGKWDEIRNFLERRDRYFINEIINRLKSEHISFEAARRAADISENNLDIYNWIMAAADAEKVNNRLRVAEYYPWIAQALADEKIAPSYKPIEKVIDNAESLISSLSDFLSEKSGYEVPQFAVRKTLRIRMENAAHIKPENFGFLLSEIARHLPQLKLEDGMLERLDYAQFNSDKIRHSLHTSFVEIMSRMPPERQNDVFTLPENEFRELVKDYSDTTDFLQQVYATLVMPYFACRAYQAGFEGLGDVICNYIRGGDMWDAAQSYVETSAYKDAQPPQLRPFGNMAVHNIVKLSQAWHTDLKLDTARMRSVQVDHNLRWPVLFNEISAPNGVNLRALRTKKDLQEEHDALGHCIANYAAHCLGLVTLPGKAPSYTHAFSMKNGKERATLVIEEPKTFYSEKIIVSFGEIDGKRKIKDVRNPPKASSPFTKAAHWLVEAINENKITINEDIHNQRGEVKIGQPMDQLSIEAGFDVTDFGKCKEAFDVRRRYLPNRYRHLSYQGWIAKMGFEEEADKLFAQGNQDLSINRLMQIARQSPRLQ